MPGTTANHTQNQYFKYESRREICPPLNIHFWIFMLLTFVLNIVLCVI